MLKNFMSKKEKKNVRKNCFKLPIIYLSYLVRLILKYYELIKKLIKI